MLVPDSWLQPGTTLDDLREHFTVHGGGVNGLLFGPEPPLRFMITDTRQHAELRDAWIDAIREHPVAYARHRASFALSFLGLTGGPFVRGNVFTAGQQPEDWSLSCPLSDLYAEDVYDAVTWLPRSSDGSTIWRPWWIILVLVGSAVLAGIRKCAEVRMLLASSVATIGVFLTLAAAPGLRYFWPVSVATSIVALLALHRFSRFRGEWDTSDGAGDSSPFDGGTDLEPIGPEQDRTVASEAVGGDVHRHSKLYVGR
jgi:hypothetical protein